MILLLAFSFLAGIFTALSPCILPVLPAIMAAGVGQGRLRPLGTVLGLIASFSFFTLSLTWLVQLTGISPNFLRYVAIALIFFFGLIMVFPRMSNWFSEITSPLTRWGGRLQGDKPLTGFWGGLIFGMALGLLWTPCAGPILAAITALVATGGVNLTAVLMTLSYGIGAGILMFLFAYGSSRIIQASKTLSHHSEGIRQFFGVMMLVFAVALSLNWDMLLSERISRYVPEILSDKNLPISQELNRLIGDDRLELGQAAPELEEISTWINSPPLKIADLKGKVVLIDFWTYSCINCLRTLPYLKKWDRDYRNSGLVIIGVHTPEFEFEKDPANVKKATENLEVAYPVALDNKYGTWKAYHNHYWPAHYLIDQQGIVRMIHFGEGAYGETENAIRELIGLKPLIIKEEKSIALPLTPETYLGYLRADSYVMKITPDLMAEYTYTEPLGSDQVGLKGAWKIEGESILSESEASFLDLNYLAAKVYLVLSGSSPTPLELRLDGQASGQIMVDGDRKYDVAASNYGRHSLSLKIPKGIRAYAFTFGNE